MKKAVAVLMVIVSVLFTACAAASISFRLDENNAAGVSYMVDLNEEENTENYINQLKEYWDEQGFETSVDRAGLTVYGEKYVQYDTPVQAAEGFAQIVTSDNVLLYDVNFEYTPSFEYDRYSFFARISLKDVIRQSQAQDIPSDVVSSVRENAAKGIFTVSVKLPGEVESSNAHSTDENTCTWVLEYGEETKLSVITEKTNTDNLAYRTDLESRIERDRTLLIICIAAVAAFLLAAAVAVIVRRIRIKRASVVRAKRFR